MTEELLKENFMKETNLKFLFYSADYMSKKEIEKTSREQYIFDSFLEKKIKNKEFKVEFLKHLVVNDIDLPFYKIISYTQSELLYDLLFLASIYNPNYKVIKKIKMKMNFFVNGEILYNCLINKASLSTIKYVLGFSCITTQHLESVIDLVKITKDLVYTLPLIEKTLKNLEKEKSFYYNF